MNELFSGDEDHSKGVQFTINEHYAKAFEYRKEREELEKLKAKYGSDYDPNDSEPEFSTDSESAESEDEDGEELTPAVDVAILRTLARIKKKDPGIYDSRKDIFGEEQEKISSVPTINPVLTVKDKVKPVTLRQAKLDSVLRGSRSPSPSAEADQLTHVQEQEKLRKETIAVFHDAVPDTEGDDFLIPRSKTKDELEREEEEYRAFLEREVGDLNELVTIDASPEILQADNEHLSASADERLPGESKKKKKKTKSSPNDKGKKTKSEEDQEFLMNYILNRGWVDHSERHVPTYNEITVGSSSKDKQKTKKLSKTNEEVEEENAKSDLDALSDASFDSLASHFEASYNHRFEEPDAAVIPAYPRNIASTVRRSDTVRKDARERKKQRKEEEIEKKKEEVRRLKALKMREVRRKLELIGREAGLKGSKGKGKNKATEDEDDGVVDEALKDLDLDGEWDPAKHDLQMAGLFERDETFFEPQHDENEEAADEEGLQFDEDGKPVWHDDIDLGDIPISDDDAFGVDEKAHKKEKKKELKRLKKQREQYQDDEGVDIDAMDADAPMNEGLEDEEWDGTEEMRKRVLDKYMDEIYGLEFNDMIGDLPTRFKYMPTEPTTYSLTPAEILMASDKELNEYMSVKKYAPYRLDKQDKHRYSKKNQDKLRELKGKLVERGGGRADFGRRDDNHGAGEGEAKQKKRKGKKERMKMKAVSGDQGVDSEQPLQDLAGEVKSLADEPTKTPSDDIRPKKRKRDISDDTGIPRPLGASGVQVEATDRGGAESDDGLKKKRKRKHKKKDGVIGDVHAE
ncbi:KRI1-like family C-terminal-domain-containing protein [Crepidotus variabilis]|uniref:KRI1-like family C-terminal-domain-containing protein n=1 Tax=Crepidotus variabilis TaxID=179855 RepID=A0A9P6E743_9AGAR|nr:KRI1-like family C-terminal-domain-containing protein [Crepidotus variabilis]